MSTPNSGIWKHTSSFIAECDESEFHVKVVALREECQYWTIRLKFDYNYSGKNQFIVSVTAKQDRGYKYRASYCDIAIRNLDSTSIAARKCIVLDETNYDNFQESITVSESLIPWGKSVKVSMTFGCNAKDETERVFFGPMKTMLEKGVLTDFTIKTKYKDIPCHKLVLAARSPFFRTMFTTPMAESEENVVHWEDVFDETTVHDLLHYVYTGAKPPNIGTTRVTLIQASHLCMLHELKEMCVSEIVPTVSIDNVVDILVMGEKYESEDLKETALNFIAEKYEELGGEPSKLDGWNDLEPQMGKSVLLSLLKINGRKRIRL